MKTDARRHSSALAYARGLFAVILRSKVVIAALVVAQLLFLLPMVAGYPTGSIAVDREMCRTNAYLAKSNLLEYGNEHPEELLGLAKQETQYLFDALDAEYPSKEYFAAFGKAREIEVAEQEAGYLTGGIETEAGATLLRQLSALDNPRVYASAQELPALNYLALSAGVMPAIVLLLPGIVAAYEALRRLHGNGLFAMAPFGEPGRYGGALLVSTLFALLSPLAVSVPAGLIALVRNGFGDPAFPVVLIKNGTVATSTVLEALGEDVALLALSATATTLLMSLINRAGALFTLGVGLTATILPLLPIYGAETSPWHAVGSWLPSSYLQLGQVIGYPTYANGLDIVTFQGTSFERGSIVLLITIATFAGAQFTASALSTHASTKRLGKETPHD